MNEWIHDGSAFTLPAACSKQGINRSSNTVEISLGEEGGGEESGGEESGEEDEQLPPLRSVFDCSYIKIRTVNDGKDGWECVWCGIFLHVRNQTKA